MTDKERIKSLKKEVFMLREQVRLLNILSEKRRGDILLLLNHVDALESRLNLGDA